jgi:DNA polymerase III subunit epsilon
VLQDRPGRPVPPAAVAEPGPRCPLEPAVQPEFPPNGRTQAGIAILGVPFPGLVLQPGLRAGPDVVVVDIETTGWLADAAAITEIGAVRLTPGQPVSEFTALVNPGAPIPPAIAELTGITDAMVAGAPPIGEVMPRFLNFAAGGVIIAHNAPFDIGFLRAACCDSGIGWPPCVVIDTAVLSRMVLRPGEVPDHKLATLAGHFGTRTGPSHRALADARATAGVLTGLLGMLAERPLPRPAPVPVPRPVPSSRPALVRQVLCRLGP